MPITIEGKKDSCCSQEGLLFTRCQGVGILALTSCRETLSLWSRFTKQSQFGDLGTWCSERLLFPLRTKCRLVGGTQRGESLLPSLLLFSLLAPRPTARLLEFKSSHVLVITLPQWPCWAQHFESHKNIIVRLLGSFVHYHKGLEKTKMLTPQGFAEAHFSDSASSLPLKSSTLIGPHCASSDIHLRSTQRAHLAVV